MRRPRLNVLRTFEAAGRRLSFSQAAEELNISQAAVSQQMRHLEAYLGDALFLRHNRRISLTSSGRAYLDVVHETLDRLDTVTDQLFSNRLRQVVTIKCTSSVATLWLAPQISAFQSRNPEIELRIRTLDIETAATQNESADLEIFISGQTDHGPEVSPLLTATVMPMAAPDYVEQYRPGIGQSIATCDLIHILGYEEDWHRWFRTFQPDGSTVPKGLAVDSSLVAIDAAMRGDGIILGRRPFVDGFLDTGKLIEVFKQPRHLCAKYFIRKNKNLKNARSTEKLRDWLLDHAEGSSRSN